MRISGFLIHITLVRRRSTKNRQKSQFLAISDEPASTSSIVKEQLFAPRQVAFQLWGELSTLTAAAFPSSDQSHFFWTFSRYA
jgi:hypothetical protein